MTQPKYNGMTEIEILDAKILEVEIEKILLRFALKELTLEEARKIILKLTTK